MINLRATLKLTHQLNNNFKCLNESLEVMQFQGIGSVDILLARRPISQEILKKSLEGGPEGIRFVSAEALIGLKIQAYINNPARELQDKADIFFLINESSLDWELVKTYADLFGQWETINELRKSKALNQKN